MARSNNNRFAFTDESPRNQGDTDIHAVKVNAQVRAALDKKPAPSVDYKGREYNSMDHQSDKVGGHHSWLGEGSRHWEVVNHLKEKGYQVRKYKRDNDNAYMGEGTTKGTTHEYEVHKGGRKAYVRHAEGTADDDLANYNELTVHNKPLPREKGHPTDNFRNFLEESGHMEGLKDALKKHKERN